jgi:ADP-heptose:LPS heptosyltransferase
LKQRWPHAELHVLANKYNAAVLPGNPDVTAVHTYVYSKQCERNIRPGWMRALADRLVLICRLRRLRFDLVIVPNGGMHKNSVQFAWQLGVRDCRWHDANTEFDDRKRAHVAHRPMRHEALSGFQLVPELGEAAAEGLALSVYPNPILQREWRRLLSRRSKPLVGLIIANKSAERRWSIEKWRRLGQRLGQRADVVVFHDPAVAFDAIEWRDVCGRHVTTSSVADLIAATSLLDIIVSADSAPVHLASALGTPVVALFENRPEKYLRWYPLGVEHVILRGGRIVDDIDVEAVEKAVDHLLACAPPLRFIETKMDAYNA